MKGLYEPERLDITLISSKHAQNSDFKTERRHAASLSAIAYNAMFNNLNYLHFEEDDTKFNVSAVYLSETVSEQTFTLCQKSDASVSFEDLLSDDKIKCYVDS